MRRGDLGLVLLAAAGDDRDAVAQGVLDAAVAAVGDEDVGPGQQLVVGQVLAARAFGRQRRERVERASAGGHDHEQVVLGERLERRGDDLPVVAVGDRPLRDVDDRP